MRLLIVKCLFTEEYLSLPSLVDDNNGTPPRYYIEKSKKFTYLHTVMRYHILVSIRFSN